MLLNTTILQRFFYGDDNNFTLRFFRFSKRGYLKLVQLFILQSDIVVLNFFVEKDRQHRYYNFELLIRFFSSLYVFKSVQPNNRNKSRGAHGRSSKRKDCNLISFVRTEYFRKYVLQSRVCLMSLIKDYFVV